MKVGTTTVLVVSTTVVAVTSAFAPPMPPKLGGVGLIREKKAQTQPSPSVASLTSATPVGQDAHRRMPSSSKSSTSSTSTTLYYSSGGDGNLFDRFARVTKGNLNKFLSKYEDPEKVMNQALIDMQDDLIRVRQAYAEVTATQRRLQQQKNQLDATADDWYRRAQLALSKSNEGLAREALARRQQYIEKAEEIQNQIDSQSGNVDRLYEGMLALEKKILEAKSKKDTMSARAKTAKETAKVNDFLSGITGKTSMDAFNRMEEKVVALEAAAEVSYEMGQASMNKLLSSAKSSDKASSAMDVESQFRRLEASSAVDDELNKLKMSMLPPSTATKKVTTTTSRVVEIPIN